MTLENIYALDRELYLLALKKLPQTFLFDDLLNEIHLRRPRFQRKTLQYRLKQMCKSHLITKQGFGKSALYTCIVDEDSFSSSEFIYTGKPINISRNPFIISM